MRGFTRLADNQAFSKGRFRADFWFGAAANEQHWIQTRGRAVWLQSFCALRLDGGAGTVEHVFFSPPIETRYTARLILGLRTQGIIDRRFSFSLISDDTAGGSTSDLAQAPTELKIGLGQLSWNQSATHWRNLIQGYEFIESYIDMIPPRTDPTLRLVTGWLEHEINPALPAGFRRLAISWTWPDGVPDIPVYLEGISVTGSATDEDT